MIRPRVLLAQLPHLLIYIENVNELVAAQNDRTFCNMVTHKQFLIIFFEKKKPLTNLNAKMVKLFFMETKMYYAMLPHSVMLIQSRIAE